MKKMISTLFILSLLIPYTLGAEEFLGAPVVDGARPTLKTDVRLELKVPLSHDEIVDYYRKALATSKDIKFREWQDATYIEDDGNRQWHSITISKGEGSSTSVVIMKDNWTWIIGTLILRYIGVFVVLLILYLGMSISGRIITSSVRRMEAKKTAG